MMEFEIQLQQQEAKTACADDHRSPRQSEEGEKPHAQNTRRLILAP